MYSHVTLASDDGKYNALENKLSKRIATLENCWKEMQDNLEKALHEKEYQIDSLKKDLNPFSHGGDHYWPKRFLNVCHD